MMNTEAGFIAAGPEKCGMKSHQKGQFQTYKKKKEGEKIKHFLKISNMS